VKIKCDDYQVVRSEADKLWSIFRNKHEKLKWDIFPRQGLTWPKYLEDLGVERVCQYSHMMSPMSYLIERVNEGPFDKIIIHDPATSEDRGFLLLDRDFAQKVLVLGELP
jgi:hypothetical protein